MTTPTPSPCSCGLPLDPICEHCDKSCAFCDERMYQLCERNAYYNRRTTARLKYELMPLVHGWMGA